MKNAIVTGASSGIGEATARLLAQRGYRLIAVARRAERLDQLKAELGDAVIPLSLDLTDGDAPAHVREAVDREFGGQLDLLVNNAGGAWRAAFGDDEKGGWENVRRTMELNFDAVVRLTEALLPVLRASAPSAIVNVSSVAARASRPKSGAYSAAKAALASWTDALHLEEKPNNVHVGMVLPGFIVTEGFPQKDIKPRWIVSKPEKAAEAIFKAGPGGKPEVIVPRGYALIPALKTFAPGLVRRGASGV
ncbi:MAG TPA: SDR family NAD(P)-dependent oxidoreductase [Thermoleophilaceae bacterium]